jgi:hypothetical protein
MSSHPESQSGFVRGKHFTSYVSEVTELGRQGNDQAAERLLLELVEGTEAEARSDGHGVAPWYYQQLAVLYRKRGEPRNEIAILERFAGQPQAPGATPPKLLTRLNEARSSISSSES